MTMYATVEDLKIRLTGFFEQLYQEGLTTPEADLAAAQSEVDAYASARYALPLASCELIRNWTLTLAEELAWSRDPTGETPENVKTRVAAVRDQLQRLSDGKIRLSGQQDGEDTAGSITLVDCDEPVFGRRKMDGY